MPSSRIQAWHTRCYWKSRMTSQPPIPVPAHVRWREFRLKSLPPLILSLVVCLIGWLWHDLTGQVGFLGVAEGTRTVVTSLQPGVISALKAQPFDRVNSGEPVVEIRPFDPRLAMDALSSDLQMARLEWQTTAGDELGFNADRIQLEIHRLRTERAVAQINLERSENEVRRNKPLFAEKLVTEEVYDLALKTRDLHRAEIETKDQALRALEARLGEIQAQVKDSTSTEVDQKRDRLARLHRGLNSVTNLLAPKSLVAPIAGLIAAVYRQPGENVAAGEPLLLINSEWSPRVIGYLRQPYPTQPELGQKVKVTTQERRPREVIGTLVQIGAQLESITNALALIPQGKLIDTGLPLVVDLPAASGIRPGEVVTLALLPNAPGQRAALPPPERSTEPGRLAAAGSPLQHVEPISSRKETKP